MGFRRMVDKGKRYLTIDGKALVTKAMAADMIGMAVTV
jgi:hypothetical protein